MRMRKKRWARPELEECKYFLKDPTSNKGKWKEAFTNNAPIHLELGCGKGNFISRISIKNPNINYIAIDLKDDMLGYARRKIEQAYSGEQVNNVWLVAYDIERIEDIFSEKDIIDRIYINFCNPWPKAKHRKRRLTYPKQLEKYKIFLKPGGEIHFKTDDSELYIDTLSYLEEAGFEIVFNTDDLSKENDENNIITEHEAMFTEQGIKIKKIIAKAPIVNFMA